MDDLPVPLWLLVLIPLALGLAPFLYAGFERWLKHKEKRLEIADAQSARLATEKTGHHDQLEQRVRVVERIVTDKGTMVADEIETLRDTPRR